MDILAPWRRMEKGEYVRVGAGAGSELSLPRRYRVAATRISFRSFGSGALSFWRGI